MHGVPARVRRPAQLSLDLAGQMHPYNGVPGRLILTRISASLAVLAPLFIVACGGTSVTEISGPSAVPGGSASRCETALGGALPTVSADGGRLEVPVVAARECAWTASVDASWAQVTPASGQGEATVVVTVAENPQASARSTAIALNGQRTTLAQAAAPCRYTLGSSVTQQPAAGGTASVQVTTNGGCSWTATSPVSWVSVSPASGQGGVTVTVRVDPNGGAARATQLTIGGERFVVEQDAVARPAPAPPAPAPAPPGSAPTPPAPAPSPGPPAPPAQCTFSLDPAWRAVDSGKQNGEVAVRTTSGCAWTARSNSGWIDVTDASGSGSRTVRYKVSRNDSPLPRAGTLTIAGQLHTVWQEGGGRGNDNDDDDDD